MDLLSCWDEPSLTSVSIQITFLEELEMGMSNMHDEDKLSASTNYNGPPSMVLSLLLLPYPYYARCFK
jgi:hypothetical protein